MARLGSGPPLVLLHGYPDNLQIFSALAPALAARHEVIAFDWPGMGLSETWPGGTTVFHQAERLAGLLDAWGLARATLLGMDMGAQPALALAMEQPARVERLIVLGALVWPTAPTSWDIRLLRRTRLNLQILRLFPRAVFERAVRTCLPPRVRLTNELREDLWSAFRRPEVRRFVSRLCGGYQGSLPRLAAGYERIRCPTLVLWGARDRHFPPSQGQALAGAVAGARLEVLPEGEHWMAWHAAGQVAARCLAGP